MLALVFDKSMKVFLVNLLISAGIAVGLLGLIEIVVWVVGFERTPAFEFHTSYFRSDLVREDEPEGWVKVVPEGQNPEGNWYFPGQRFLRIKTPGTTRVIMIGDSCVAGFAKCCREEFERKLAEGLGRPVEVIAMPRPGCGSTASLGTAAEAMDLEPDIVLVYTGHSDFISQQTLGTLLVDGRPREELSPAALWLFRNLHSFQLLYKWMAPAMKPTKSEARKIERHYRKKDKESMYAIFRTNLERIVSLARGNDVKVVLATQAYSYVYPPLFGGSLENPEAYLGDPHAEFQAGLTAFAGGDYETARRLLDASFVHHSRPDRMGTIKNGIVVDVARDHGVPLADIKAAIDQASEHGMADRELIEDNCHPTVDGYRIMMAEFVRTVLAEFR